MFGISKNEPIRSGQFRLRAPDPNALPKDTPPLIIDVFSYILRTSLKCVATPRNTPESYRIIEADVKFAT